MLLEIESIMVSLFAANIVLGFSMNLVVISALCRVSGKSVRDILLISLALCGLLETGLGYAIELYGRLNVRASSLLCQMAGFSVTFFALSSIFHIVGLAIERYLSIVCAVNARGYFSMKHRALYIIFPAWINGLVWSIAPFLGWGAYKREPIDKYRCSVLMSDVSFVSWSYTIMLLTFAYAIPLLVILYCCLKVQCTLNAMSKNISDPENRTRDSGLEATKQAEKRHYYMVCAIIVTFFVAWTPYATSALLFSFLENVPNTLITYSAFFAKFSVVANPVIYVIFYKDCRKQVKKMVCVDTAVAPIEA
uniref:Opsin n=1 Tax=Cladonema radiatum TaxID=264074 RepID=A9CR48_9CNID|nr:opsin [Cladonema radiatum]